MSPAGATMIRRPGYARPPGRHHRPRHQGTPRRPRHPARVLRRDRLDRGSCPTSSSPSSGRWCSPWRTATSPRRWPKSWAPAVVSSSDTEWTNTALIQDPQGAPARPEPVHPTDGMTTERCRVRYGQHSRGDDHLEQRQQRRRRHHRRRCLPAPGPAPRGDARASGCAARSSPGSSTRWCTRLRGSSAPQMSRTIQTTHDHRREHHRGQRVGGSRPASPGATPAELAATSAHVRRPRTLQACAADMAPIFAAMAGSAPPEPGMSCEKPGA